MLFTFSAVSSGYQCDLMTRQIQLNMFLSSQMCNNRMVGGTENILIPNCMQSGGERVM